MKSLQPDSVLRANRPGRPHLSPLLRHPPCTLSSRPKRACIVRYKAEPEDGATTSSSQAAAKTEMMAVVGVASASGVDLHSEGRSHSSLQKLKTQVDNMASR